MMMPDIESGRVPFSVGATELLVCIGSTGRFCSCLTLILRTASIALKVAILRVLRLLITTALAAISCIVSLLAPTRLLNPETVLAGGFGTCSTLVVRGWYCAFIVDIILWDLTWRFSMIEDLLQKAMDERVQRDATVFEGQGAW